MQKPALDGAGTSSHSHRTARRNRLLKANNHVQRCWLLVRLSWHLMRGLLVAWLVYPRLGEQGQRRAMRTWSRQLLAILSVRVRITAVAKQADRCVLVCNHISWLDIFVIAARYPAIFVAKSEIRRWPLVGSLCARAGTVFIERGRHASARRTNAVLNAAIARGALISIFPEGTTTDGRHVGRFHAALFQPAIDSEAWIQPAAIRYIDAADAYCDAPNFVGETTFLESLWHITAMRRIVAEFRLPACIPAAGSDRRILAAEVHAAIENCLHAAYGRAPEKAAGHRAAPR